MDVVQCLHVIDLAEAEFNATKTDIIAFDLKVPSIKLLIL